MKENTASKRVMISAALVTIFLALAPMISTRRVSANTFTVTSLNDSGMGSLRQAILDANSNPGDDTINITVTGTIPLDSALPDLSTNMTISGPGARLLRVERNTTDRIRIFTITAGATVNISGLRVSEGFTADGADGGNAVSGGGIFNSGTLNLTGVNVVNNRTGRGLAPISGGTFGGDGGGILNASGATLTLLNCTVRNNETGPGGRGGIGGGGSGGGIHNSGTLTITNSTIFANRAGEGDGSNSFGIGGGILNTGVITLTGCTIAQNAALRTSALRGSGISNNHGGTATVRNTIIADNGPFQFNAPDFAGPAISEGFNLIGNDNGSSGFTHPTDQKNVSPRLYPIGNYGGQTETCALQSLSPAIDKGKNFAMEASNQPILTDQRGQPRPFDTAIPDAAGGDGSDIGSFEARDNFASFVVNSTADTDDGACDPLGTGTGNMDCTLREAINAANFDFGTETITFDPTVFASPGSYIIQLTDPLPDLISDLTINSPSANLLSVHGEGAANRYRIFTILLGMTVNISGLTVTNGQAPGVADNSDGNSGGGIINFGTLNVTGVVVSGNRAGKGGLGIAFDSDGVPIPGNGGSGGRGGGIANFGTLTLLNSTVSGNHAGDGGDGTSGGSNGRGGGGGGIVSTSGATLTLMNSTVSGNRTGAGSGNSEGGGGINNDGTLTITNTTISVNQAGGQGGGIDSGSNTSLTVSNSTITANTANGVGGGIFRLGGAFTLRSTIVAGNSASSAPDLNGVAQSDGFNLIQSTAGATINQNPGAGPNMTGQDAQLGPLTNNGGPTDTHALVETSPAIDQGKNFATDASNNPIFTDQRGDGFPRPADFPAKANAPGGDGSDIGAFELQPCTLTCPANISQNNDPGQCGAVVNYSDPMATSGDIVCGAVTCSPPKGSFFPIGTTTVSCNASGTTADPDCTFTVTVNDTQPPQITCLANITQSTDPNQCSALVNYPAPTVSDNCGCGENNQQIKGPQGASCQPTCNPLSGSSFLKGTTTVTCMASDTAGNPVSCTFTVTVNDTQSPTMTCPANIILPAETGQCTAVATFAPTVSDNCPKVGTPVCTPASGSTFQKGTTTVSCTVSDADGLTANCMFTVTINDAQNPTITCPANVSATTTAGQCSKVVSYANATATDNCPKVGTPSCTPPSGSIFARGVTTVTCTVTDGVGLTANCSFTVTVNDTQAPAIACPVSIVSTIPSGNCVMVSYPAPVATDNCAGVTVVCSPASGSCFPVGTTTVSCTATDASGNTSSCSFTVSTFDICIQDDGNPTTVILINSLTGHYRFCCNGSVFTGVGTIKKKGTVTTLEHNPANRRVSARVDKSSFTGTGYIQQPPGSNLCTIQDRDTRDNTCICQ
jgi:CSLREA domain-containing protein